MATKIPSDQPDEDYLRLKGWHPHESVPGVWTCPQGTGDYSTEEAEAVQRQRDEREGRS